MNRNLPATLFIGFINDVITYYSLYTKNHTAQVKHPVYYSKALLASSLFIHGNIVDLVFVCRARKVVKLTQLGMSSEKTLVHLPLRFVGTARS